MKKSISTLLITFCCASFTMAQSGSEDYTAVSKTLNYYLVGGTNNDFNTLAKAFHTDATMKFVNNDGYKSVNALEFFKSGMKPGSAQDRKTQILSINISGKAAQAKLQIEYDTFYFYDYMQLLKIDNEWKIISKTFNKVTK